MAEITRLLLAIESGDQRASSELLPLVYDELRRLAAHRLVHEKPGQTLQATALVHEAYIRLVGSNGSDRWDNHGHFFAAAAEAMRRILIDNARQKDCQRRGGQLGREALDHANPQHPNNSDRLLALDEALGRLEEQDETKAKLVKLRYFAGLTVPQAAKALGVSVATANRHWTYARAWLHEALRDDTE